MNSATDSTIMDTRKIAALLRQIALACALFIAYGSLVPFDFQARSLDEIRRTILSQGTPANLISLTDRLVNLLLSLPLAFFAFGAAVRAGRPWRNGIAALAVAMACVLFAGVLEFLQIFLPTRSASLTDVVAQSIGACVGITLWVLLGDVFVRASRMLFLSEPVEASVDSRSPWFMPLAAGAYLIVLLALNGWITSGWVSLAEATRKARELHYPPFYYHYYASIFRSCFSVAAYLVEYAPVGIAFWYWTRARGSVVSAALVGGGIALVIEAGKLLLVDKHPDTTNIFLSALSSAMAFWLWPRIARCFRARSSSSTTASQREAVEATQPAAVSAIRLIGLRAISIAVLIAVMFGLRFYPMGSFWLAGAVGLYSLVMLRFPAVWLVVIPALLPSFDLAPWTGWFFLNEFDFFVLASIGAGLWVSAAQAPRAFISGALRVLLFAFGASTLVSLLIGLLPLEDFDFNAFANYHSRYNALLAAKGFVEALSLLPLLLYTRATGVNIPRRLTSGMVLGLASVVLAALWERAVFPGIFNFSSDFRISALFSSMHTGDSQVEAYLVAALPFTLAWTHYQKSLLQRALAVGLFGLGTYALFVTFSRGGYAAFAMLLAILVAGAVMTGRDRSITQRSFLTVLGLAVAVGGFTAASVMEGSFARSRLAQSEADLSVRLHHWRNVVGIIEPGWQAAALGMGLGSYPRTYFTKNWAVKMPATFAYVTEGGNTFLRLGSGAPAYLEQIVAVQPNADYRLSLDLRRASSPGSLNVMICERTFFRSFNCRDSGVWSTGTEGAWLHHETVLNSGLLGSGPWFARRTVKLLLENTSRGGSVDIDNIHLADSRGHEVVANSDFSKGNTYWFYSSFDHLPWHIKNIWVQLLFEQGWLGLVTFFLLLAYGLLANFMMARQASVPHVVLLASMGGFLSVGLFGSPLDAPRLALLFYLILLAGAVSATAKIIGDATPNVAGVPIISKSPVILTGGSEAASSEMIAEASGDSAPARQIHADDVHLPNRSIWHGAPIKKCLGQILSGIAVSVGLAWLVIHFSAVPYNVRDLLHPVHPLSSLLVLSLFIYWSLGFSILISYWITRSRAMTWFYPGLAAAHAIVAWFILTYAVSFERILKIVGSPVLHWHWYWEPAGRFVALYASFSLSMTFGTLIVVSLWYKRAATAAFLCWLVTAVALSPLLYWVVVNRAATDNITELMAGGGTAMSALLLASFVALVSFGGSLLAAQFHAPSGRSRLIAAIAVVISVPAAYLGLAHGTAGAVEKYGKVFSALQFLLSADREHYSQGPELILRYLIFHAVALGAIVLVQWPLFSWLFKAPARSAALKR